MRPCIKKKKYIVNKKLGTFKGSDNYSPFPFTFPLKIIFSRIKQRQRHPNPFTQFVAPILFILLTLYVTLSMLYTVAFVGSTFVRRQGGAVFT